MKKDFRPFMKRLEAISCSDSKTEEVVRVWCIDILRSVLGYKDEDIDLELSALGDRIDIALKHEGNVVLIIECKGIDNKLPAKARDQAVKYAATKNASWAAVTSDAMKKWRPRREWAFLRVRGKSVVCDL
jgi:predicted type IV restriction endonuclease